MLFRFEHIAGEMGYGDRRAPCTMLRIKTRSS
jgi:hypothetical protein